MIQLHKYILIVFLLFLGLAPQAQNLKSQASIDVAYFGHGGIRPGFKIASSLPLYHWTPPQGDSIKFSLMARPEVAFYGRRNFYSTALGNLEFSLMRTQASSQNAWGINVGFGYMQRFEVTSVTVNLAGDIVARERDPRVYICPNMGLRWERDLNERIRLLTELDYGIQRSSQREKSGNFFVAFGIVLDLAKTDNSGS